MKVNLQKTNILQVHYLLDFTKRIKTEVYGETDPILP